VKANVSMHVLRKKDYNMASWRIRKASKTDLDLTTSS